jgi:Domain of Unknown Function (DUF1080)
VRPAVSKPALALALGAALSACGDRSQEATDGADAARSDGGDAPTEIDARDAADETAAPWRSLFDGNTLAAWDRYLGKPSASEAPLGLDDDPLGVFSIVALDGGAAIRVSGEVWGALISKETFCDFHLRAQYKWGALLWPPLDTRDSGLMYLSTGPLGAVNAGGPALSDPAGSGAFLVSIEYQIAPSDVGDLVALGPIAFTSLGRVVPAERADDWNDVDIVVRGGVATHTFNGVEVARAQGFVLDWSGAAPTTLGCGKLQLQSEGAEIFFRGVEIETPP